MMPTLRDRVVDREGWMTQPEFGLGLGLCQALPGGTLMQLAAYVGLKLRGLAGAMAGYLGFSAPAFLLISVLGAFYAGAQSLPASVAAFAGLKVVVLGICLAACREFVVRFAPTPRHLFFTVGAAVLFLAGAGVIPIIGGAILGGILFLPPGPAPRLARNGQTPRTLGLALGLLALDLGLLALLFVFDRQLFDLSVSMVKVDMLAFGGFGVIPVMFEEVVRLHAWMDEHTFMDGVALAQITPGPTMLASAFVGYWMRGVVGAAVASVSIFAGSFIVILAAAQYRDQILASQTARKALSGVLATLGGMIVAVSVSLGRAVDWGWPQYLVLALSLAALWKRVPVPLIVIAGAGLSAWLF
jgi:chromate transporter